MSNQLLIRDVRPEDDAQLADLIKQVMTEIGAVGDGYSINDPEVLGMSQNYGPPRAGLLVLARGDEVLGCGGFAPLVDAPETVCELRKMYFLPAARGQGQAQVMLTELMGRAKAAGYTKMYLETIAGAGKARALYERNGFVQISGPQGNTGHCSCDTFYEREL